MFLPRRFPKIFDTCQRFGIDIRRDLIPVYPSAHYAMGGVRTDLWGYKTKRVRVGAERSQAGIVY